MPKLSPAEVEKVIVLVGRHPRLYPPGTVQALESNRAVLPPQPTKAFPQKAVANEKAEPSKRAFRTGPEGAQGPPERPKRTQPTHVSPGRRAALRAVKAGTAAGTRNETARRRLIVEDCMPGASPSA
jgi:hypothetical protein